MRRLPLLFPSQCKLLKMARRRCGKSRPDFASVRTWLFLTASFVYLSMSTFDSCGVRGVAHRCAALRCAALTKPPSMPNKLVPASRAASRVASPHTRSTHIGQQRPARLSILLISTFEPLWSPPIIPRPRLRRSVGRATRSRWPKEVARSRQLCGCPTPLFQVGPA